MSFIDKIYDYIVKDNELEEYFQNINKTMTNTYQPSQSIPGSTNPYLTSYTTNAYGPSYQTNTYSSSHMHTYMTLPEIKAHEFVNFLNTIYVRRISSKILLPYKI